MQNYNTQQLNTLPIAEFSDKFKQVEEARTVSRNLSLSLASMAVDWGVIADARVKGGLIVEEIQKEPTTRPRD